MATDPDDAGARELDDGKDKKPGAGGKSFVKAHRDQILIVLTLTGVIIAYLAFKKPAAAANPTSTSYDPTAAAGTPSTGGPGDSGGAIDGFTANLSHMSDLLDQLNANVGALGDGTSTSTPKPFDYSSMNHSWASEPASAGARFLYGRAASGLHYIRNRRTGRVGQVNPNGRVFWLSGGQYAELGHPKTTDYGRKKPPPKPPKPKPRARR